MSDLVEKVDEAKKKETESVQAPAVNLNPWILINTMASKHRSHITHHTTHQYSNNVA